MSIKLPATHFRQLQQTTAQAVLVATILLVALLLIVAFHYQMPPSVHPGDGDLALYRRIVERMHAGQSYYPAAHAELVANLYATLSVLNWRTPLYPWVLSRFPSIEAAQIILGFLATAAALTVGGLFLRRVNRPLAWVAVIVALGSLLACILGATVLYSENLAGVLILFSAAAFGLGWRRAGFAGAVLALFVRELAALYVLVCLFLAWREKRFVEVAAWLLAILAYGLFFLWHAQMVHAQLGPTDFSYPGGWLRFGGASFILATARFNGLFMLFPMWVSAIVLPLAVLGLLAWPGREAPRFLLTAGGYIVAFAFFGKPQNGYWGAVYMPVVTIGLVWAVPATLDLVRAATLRRSVTDSSPHAAEAT